MVDADVGAIVSTASQTCSSTGNSCSAIIGSGVTIGYVAGVPSRRATPRMRVVGTSVTTPATVVGGRDPCVAGARSLKRWVYAPTLLSRAGLICPVGRRRETDGGTPLASTFFDPCCRYLSVDC